MGQFFDRYVAGECETVWSELIQLGASVREPAHIEDALAVARETMGRARQNLEAIYARLRQFGYEFAAPDEAFILADSRAGEQIDEIERTVGMVPLSVRAWYETFDSVDFHQSLEQARGGNPLVSGLGWGMAWRMRDLRQAWERRQSYAGEEELFAECGQEFPWGLPKVSIGVGDFASNCNTKGFFLPDPRADSVFYDDGGGPQYFVADLRFYLRWGGFPLCAHYLRGGQPVWGSKPDVERLVPALTEGLLAL